MIITRNGIDIELTKTELMLAFDEAQHLIDIDDVLYFADICDDNYKGQPYIDLIRDPDVADEVARRYRDYRNDEDDQSWFNDMSEAVMEVGSRISEGREEG